MKIRTRQLYSYTERLELWRRWQQGDTISAIALALNRKPGTIHALLSASGGIAPRLQTRSERVLSLSDREAISRGLALGDSMRQIADAIGRAPSTVSREVARHGGRIRYRATEADSAAWKAARRPKVCKLAQNPRLCRMVARRLRQNWSPEQIAGALKRQYADEATMQISHETIYRTLFLQARGVLKRELMAHLRSRRKMRRSRYASTKGQKRGQIIDAVSISERPAEVEDRAVPGHWEGDLIAGSKNSHIATLVERRSRFLMLVKVNGKDTNTVVGALSKQVRKMPSELLRSLTWDRGSEMAAHKAFTIATEVKVYFCDPKSPWQRGSNENTNGLLRQYFPKGIDVSVFSQVELNKVAKSLNQRPRKTLGFRTPAEVLYSGVALTD